MREHLKAFYRTYRNEYLSIGVYADHLHMSEEHVAVLVDMGRELHEEDAARGLSGPPPSDILAEDKPLKHVSSETRTTASAPKDPDLYGYIALYNGKRHELYASSSGRAFDTAVAYFNPPKSKRHMVSVTLAERPDGTTVTHTAVD